MNTTSLTKILLVLNIVVLSLIVTPMVFAKKGGNGGGKPPPPPPVNCTDDFPGFSYGVEATRRSPGEIWLASSDGCRRELIAVESDDGRGIGSFHMTADKSKGVILWKEDPGLTWQWVVHRQDFTVENGDLNLVPTVQLLPQAGEDVQPGDELYYFNLDI